MLKTFVGIGLALTGVALHANADSFNINFSDSDASTQLGAGDTAAGIYGTAATDWQNIGTGNTTLNSVGGLTATFTRNEMRNAGRTHGVVRTNNLTDGNATLLDYHMNGTATQGAAFDSAVGFGEEIVDFEITDIPFAQYDVVVYFGYNAGQYTGSARFNDTGILNVRINDDVEPLADLIAALPDTNDPDGDGTDTGRDWWDLVIPDGEGGTTTNGAVYTEFLANIPGEIQFDIPLISNAADDTLEGTLDDALDGEGNYIVFSGLTDTTFKLQAWGEYFMHGGPSGFQIVEVPEPSSLALLGLGGLLIARRRRG